MIVPTRFGLKYAPIPTLALEYEDDLKGVVDSSAASLYVYRDDGSAPPAGPARKLHVVELPMLTPTSETKQVLRRLQQDNGRFLAPGVVNEAQLKRLLDRLVANLHTAPEPEHSTERDEDISPPASRQSDGVKLPGKFGHVQEEDAKGDKRSERIGDADEPNDDVEEHESDLDEVKEHEESFLEESTANASQSLEHEQAEEGEASVSATASHVIDVADTNPNRGTFLSQEEESDEEEDKKHSYPDGGADNEQPAGEEGHFGQGNESTNAIEMEGVDTTDSAAAAEDEKEKEEDVAKVRALRNEEEISDEDVQSEELEYFSEDGSDEDSF